MKILAVDTATASCSVAVTDNESVLSEVTIHTGQTHSRCVMRLIITACELCGVTVTDMDGFAVSIGPGSFTGLRIGISTVKGLAYGAGKPVVGISTLDAIAFQFPYSPHLICVLIDARKQQVYACRYRYQTGTLKKERSETVLSPEEAIADIHEPCLFVGTGALLYKPLILNTVGTRAYFAPPGSDRVRASSIALLSLKRFENHQTDSVESLTPHYIRESDADLNFGKTITHSGNSEKIKEII